MWSPLPCNAPPAVLGERGRTGGVPNRGGLRLNEFCSAAARADWPGPGFHCDPSASARGVWLSVFS